jgi:parallel beta-helix repeat protein
MYGILVVAWTSGTAAGSAVSGNTISNTNWEGIQSDVPVTITNNDISGGYNGIQLSNAASGSVVDGNNIHDNRYWGLSILDSVTDVTVENNQLSYNPYCGVIVQGDGEGSGILINCNEITGNGIFGVESKRTNSNVDATQNWWGDASGPYHSTNSGGNGDEVSDNVNFEPWSFTPDPCEAKTIGFWKTHGEC